MDERKQQLIEHFITKCSMAIEEAKKKADMNVILQDRMRTNDVKFSFIKKDGTIREAHGTLREDVLPEIKGTGRPLSFELQLYFDLDKQCFRSFKKHNLIDIHDDIRDYR